MPYKSLDKFIIRGTSMSILKTTIEYIQSQLFVDSGITAFRQDSSQCLVFYSLHGCIKDTESFTYYSMQPTSDILTDQIWCYLRERSLRLPPEQKIGWEIFSPEFCQTQQTDCSIDFQKYDYAAAMAVRLVTLPDTA